jgi:hypothetical protein
MAAAGYAALDERRAFNEEPTREYASYHAADYKDATTGFWTATVITGLVAYGSYRLFKRGRRLNMHATAPPASAGPPGLSFGGSF